MLTDPNLLCPSKDSYAKTWTSVFNIMGSFQFPSGVTISLGDTNCYNLCALPRLTRGKNFSIKIDYN